MPNKPRRVPSRPRRPVWGGGRCPASPDLTELIANEAANREVLATLADAFEASEAWCEAFEAMLAHWLESANVLMEAVAARGQ